MVKKILLANGKGFLYITVGKEGRKKETDLKLGSYFSEVCLETKQLVILILHT